MVALHQRDSMDCPVKGSAQRTDVFAANFVQFLLPVMTRT